MVVLIDFGLVVYKLEAVTVDLVESEHGISIFFVIAVDFFFT
ncbi:hypothetical protein BFJ63_vAg17919 [Fusarium oxysporum f. sp. narcissi]|uniref:Uncharacterized protein n=1 Tax=Fusarium oxysporum f. sp. narcissi TaxID=451672 RepID=A0A4Q2UYN6_FUSOX|nr:hypothetical protein BFJ63_vAg17919 [Fusarium oxysporum f. sp. narcissi]